MRKLYLLLVIVFLTINYTNAQTSDLTKEVEESIKQQCMLKVDAFTNHVVYIADKDNPADVKEHHINAALNLFSGKGGDVKDEYGNVEIPAPRMEVSSVNTQNIRSYLIKQYLINLENLPYTDVKIEKTNCAFVSNLKQVGTNKYEAVLSFAQVFIGKRDGVVVYRDRTKKDVKVYIEQKDYGEKTRWEILLGDISVKATEIL